MATPIDTPSGTRRATAPSRRDLMSAAGFTALAGIAGVAVANPDAPEPDAELIALCDRFIDLELQIETSFERQDVRITYEEEKAIAAVERDPLVDQQKPIFEAMMQLRATTLEGLRARARALVIYDREGWKGREISHGPFPGGMNFALVRDLVGEAV